MSNEKKNFALIEFDKAFFYQIHKVLQYLDLICFSVKRLTTQCTGASSTRRKSGSQLESQSQLHLHFETLTFRERSLVANISKKTPTTHLMRPNTQHLVFIVILHQNHLAV